MDKHDTCQVVTDSNYYPLPTENPDLALSALDLAYRAMRCREAKRYDLSAAIEADLGRVCRMAYGHSREKIEGIQQTLARDMSRRLRDSKPALRSVK
jgi:hypothetical protein